MVEFIANYEAKKAGMPKPSKIAALLKPQPLTDVNLPVMVKAKPEEEHDCHVHGCAAGKMCAWPTCISSCASPDVVDEETGEFSLYVEDAIQIRIGKKGKVQTFNISEKEDVRV
jgi:hypothetical protein